jgi:hypothetical protein
LSYRNCVDGTYNKNRSPHSENRNTVSQHNTDETKEDPHADSNDSSGMRNNPLGEPTESTDDEDPLQEPIEGAHEEDSKVGKIMKLTVFRICCIETIDIYQSFACYLFHSSLLLRLFLCTEDGGDMFL